MLYQKLINNWNILYFGPEALDYQQVLCYVMLKMPSQKIEKLKI